NDVDAARLDRGDPPAIGEIGGVQRLDESAAADETLRGLELTFQSFTDRMGDDRRNDQRGGGAAEHPDSRATERAGRRRDQRSERPSRRGAPGDEQRKQDGEQQ